MPGFTPLPEDRVVLVGARDFDGGERERLGTSAIAYVEPGRLEELPEHLQGLRPAVRRVSLHVDLDVLDPSAGRANAWAVAPGLSVQDLLACVQAVQSRVEIAALTLSAYDPIFDLDGRVREAALAVIGAVARCRGVSGIAP